MVSTVGSWILASGIILMVVNMIIAARRGEQAPANPWGATTLEWKTTSPPPQLNFAQFPENPGNPYDFSEILADRARERAKEREVQT